MKNEGTSNRAIRVIVGLAILSLAFIGPQSPRAYIGVAPLLTGLVGAYPLYKMIGINTCPDCQQ